MGYDGFLESRMVFRGAGELLGVAEDFLRGDGGGRAGSGKGLATRQAGNVLLGGASGAGSLLLNTKASQEAACSGRPLP